MSRGESIEGPEAVKPAERLLRGRARRVLFPRASQSFFSFRTSAGSFLLAFPFLLREKKRGDSGYTVRAFLLVRMILLTFFFGYKPRLYPGFRVENRVTPHQVRDDKRRVFPGSRIKCGMTGCRVGVRDDSAGPPGNRGGHKKRAGGLSSSDFLPAHLLRWRLPTLPLAQYHRRDGA